MKRMMVIASLLLAGGLAYVMWPAENQDRQTASMTTNVSSVMTDVILPEVLSENALIGKRAFEASCASCHGTNAAGQGGVAPPLIHKIYEPSHHGDESFQRAAAIGVRAHHWRFGDMPAVEGITRGEVTFIITYIRELQRANGIN